MIIVGISGLIATGKTTFSNLLKQHNIAVFDADMVARSLIEQERVNKLVSRLIPQSLTNNKLDRKKLSSLAFNNRYILQKLQKIIHPLVRKEMKIFLKRNFYLKQKIILLDIPLLFESGIDNICDYVILVKCSYNIQKQRYLLRENSSEAKLQQILRFQSKNIFKEKKADFILDSSLSDIRNSLYINNIINKILHYERSCTGYRNYGFKSRKWR